MKNYETKEVKNDLYGFTIKINTSKAPTEGDYISLIKRIEKKVKIVNYVFEDKKKDGSPTKLHVHGLYESKRNLLLNLGRGISVKTEGIYDMDGWHKYCNKNNPLTKAQETKFLSDTFSNTEYLF